MGNLDQSEGLYPSCSRLNSFEQHKLSFRNMPDCAYAYRNPQSGEQEVVDSQVENAGLLRR